LLPEIGYEKRLGYSEDVPLPEVLNIEKIILRKLLTMNLLT